MRLSVTPEDLAVQLIEELGLNQAQRECDFFKNIPGDDEKQKIWCDISLALSKVQPGEHRT